MAVAQMVDSALKLVLDDGIDPKTGEPTYATKGFNNVKVTATPDQLFLISNAVAALQQRPLVTIERSDDSEISRA